MRVLRYLVIESRLLTPFEDVTYLRSWDLNEGDCTHPDRSMGRLCETWRLLYFSPLPSSSRRTSACWVCVGVGSNEQAVLGVSWTMEWVTYFFHGSWRFPCLWWIWYVWSINGCWEL